MLDEPSMGLAPLLMYDMFRALKELNEEGMTILLIEQNANLAPSSSPIAAMSLTLAKSWHRDQVQNFWKTLKSRKPILAGKEDIHKNKKRAVQMDSPFFIYLLKN